MRFLVEIVKEHVSTASPAGATTQSQFDHSTKFPLQGRHRHANFKVPISLGVFTCAVVPTVDQVWMKFHNCPGKKVQIKDNRHILHYFIWLWIKIKICIFDSEFIPRQSNSSSSRLHSHIYIQTLKTNLATGTVNHFVCLSVPPSSLKEIKYWKRNNESLFNNFSFFFQLRLLDFHGKASIQHALVGLKPHSSHPGGATCFYTAIYKSGAADLMLLV